LRQAVASFEAPPAGFTLRMCFCVLLTKGTSTASLRESIPRQPLETPTSCISALKAWATS
jgi:hypothetical protein